MTIQHVIELFEQYGLPMMAAVFFCEYLNLPGFPAGIIMPAVGILIGQSQMSLILSIAVSVAAGLAGCLVIYFICYYGGAPLLNKLFGKNAKFHHFVQECHARLEVSHGRAAHLPAYPGAAHHCLHPGWAAAHAASGICHLVGNRDYALEHPVYLRRLFFQRSVFERHISIRDILMRLLPSSPCAPARGKHAPVLRYVLFRRPCSGSRRRLCSVLDPNRKTSFA